MARVVLVSGAARGYGPAIARLLAEQGAQVVLQDEEAAARSLQEALAADGLKVLVAPGRVPDAAAAQRMVDAVYQAAGRLDVLVTVADPAADLPLLAISQATWLDAFDRDVHGAFFMLQAAARYMLLDRRGRIVVVTAEPGAYPQRAQSAAAAAMGALHSLTRALAIELAPKQIGVNAVVPGPFGLEAEPGVSALTPLQRVVKPREVAELVAFLASDDASYVTGERYHVDGGLAGRR